MTLVFDTENEARRAFENPLIAKIDITCWKVLRKESDGTLQSPYQNMNYEPGFIYYQIGVDFVRDIVPAHGFAVQGWLLRITDGLHSYSTEKRAKINGPRLFSSRVAVKMIIPKGSKYFYCPLTNEYCSNQILFPHQ